jgi:hypothetical protein
MKSQRELDHAEIGSEMATSPRQRDDEPFANLLSQRFKLRDGKLPEIGRGVNVIE